MTSIKYRGKKDSYCIRRGGGITKTPPKKKHNTGADLLVTGEGGQIKR